MCRLHVVAAVSNGGLSAALIAASNIRDENPESKAFRIIVRVGRALFSPHEGSRGGCGAAIMLRRCRRCIAIYHVCLGLVCNQGAYILFLSALAFARYRRSAIWPRNI